MSADRTIGKIASVSLYLLRRSQNQRAMRFRFTLLLFVLAAARDPRLSDQDLSPRAYVITPVSSDATITYPFFCPDILLFPEGIQGIGDTYAF